MSTHADVLHRSNLKSVSSSLRKLHKSLIDLESARFGPIDSTFAHLQLVSSHPQFAWIRGLSEILVELDERLDESEAVDDVTVSSYKTLIESLLSLGPENDTEFSKKYLDALQDSTEVAMAHGALRHALLMLSAGSDGLLRPQG